MYACMYSGTILLARQASAGRLMLCRCYFLSYSFFFFFTDRLEQRDLQDRSSTNFQGW